MQKKDLKTPTILLNIEALKIILKNIKIYAQNIKKSCGL